MSSVFHFFIVLLTLLATVYISSSAFAACSSPTEQAGTIEKFEVDNIMKYCNGTNWIDLGIAGNDGAGNTDPTIVKNFNQMSGVRDAQIIGNYIYYVSYTSNIFGIIDISTPEDPVLVGYVQDYTNLQQPHAFDISGNYAYVITQKGTNDLTVIDISTPSAPSITATYDTPAASGKDVTEGNYWDMFDIDVDGNYAYVTIRSGAIRGIIVIDISTPSAPSEVGSLNNASSMDNARSIKVSGNYAYVAASASDALTIVDISTPSSPTQVGTITNTDLDGAQVLELSGTDVYVMTTLEKLNIIDVSTPATPVSRSVFDLTTLGSGIGVSDRANTFSIDGNYLYMGSYRTVGVVDISDPDNPAAEGYLYYVDNGNVSNYHLLLNGTYAYGISGGVSVLDITTPATPTLDESYAYMYDERFIDTVTQSAASKVYGDYMYLAEETSDVNVQRIHVMDVSDPLNPVLKGNVDISATRPVKAMDYHEGYLYIASDAWGYPMNILDVSNPNSPSFVSRIANADILSGHNGLYDIQVNYPYLYVFGLDSSTVAVIDASNPASPVVRGNLSHANFAGNGKIGAIDSFIYVANNPTNTLTVVDASDSDSLTIRGTLSLDDILGDPVVEVNKGLHRIYFNGGNSPNDFSVVDVSDPDNPVLLGGANASFTACRAVYSGDYIFTSSYARFQVWDASDLGNITQEYNISDDALLVSGCNVGMTIAGSYVYVNSYNGPVVIDPGTNFGAGTTTALCTAPTAQFGAMHFDYSTYTLRVCNGSGWEKLGADGDGGAGCTSPTGVTGSMHYDTGINKYKYCEGDSWITIN